MTSRLLLNLDSSELVLFPKAFKIINNLHPVTSLFFFLRFFKFLAYRIRAFNKIRKLNHFKVAILHHKAEEHNYGEKEKKRKTKKGEQSRGKVFSQI